jgi:large subunit ribosomal protein L22
VLNEVRGREVEDALNFLHFSKAKAATQIEKTVRSAVANLMNIDSESEVNTAELHIKECYADGGPHMKRFRAASMGRISKLNKPTSHLTIVVSDEKN